MLDPAEPVSMGAMVGPEAFTEVRFLEHFKQLRALELIPQQAQEFAEIFGRDSGGLIKSFGLRRCRYRRRHPGFGDRHHETSLARDA